LLKTAKILIAVFLSLISLIIGVVILIGEYHAYNYRVAYQATPPIFKDLPSTFSQADKVFKERIQDTFPVGQDEKVLNDFIEKYNFHLYDSDDGFKLASYEIYGLVCNLEWSIIWKAENNRIADIKAHYGATCL